MLSIGVVQMCVHTDPGWLAMQQLRHVESRFLIIPVDEQHLNLDFINFTLVQCILVDKQIYAHTS